MKETIISVEGMACGGCENRIKNALLTIKGITEVYASHVNKTVKVVFTDDVSENSIKEKIQDIGFTVKE